MNTVQAQQAAVEALSEQLTQLKADLAGKQEAVGAAYQRWSSASEAYRLFISGTSANQQMPYLSMLGDGPVDVSTARRQLTFDADFNAAAQAVVQTGQGYAEAYADAAAVQAQQAALQKHFNSQSAALKTLQTAYASQLAAATVSMDTFNLQLGDQYLSALGPGGAAAPAALQAVAFALAQQGKPYVFGASGTDSYDCSSLVQESYRYAGISLPRTARPQWRITRPVQVDALLPGDLLFFATDRNNWDSIHHVAIYLGNGKMIHAPQSGDVVRIAPVWWAEFFGATRVVGAVPPGQSGTIPTIPSGGGGPSQGSQTGPPVSKPPVRKSPVTKPPVSKPPGTPSTPTKPSTPPASVPPSDRPNKPPAKTPTETAPPKVPILTELQRLLLGLTTPLR
ncbi:C40 family peptidase [Fodinicola feengrottensis]|uniref:C40 family peptidase n=1 Tax=Fodinicola feengrottensis TaxID=435914 RepID=UPI0024418392|nr:C40 family peptidase [Fodinicola feengrottensis]